VILAGIEAYQWHLPVDAAHSAPSPRQPPAAQAVRPVHVRVALALVVVSAGLGGPAGTGVARQGPPEPCAGTLTRVPSGSWLRRLRAQEGRVLVVVRAQEGRVLVVVRAQEGRVLVVVLPLRWSSPVPAAGF